MTFLEIIAGNLFKKDKNSGITPDNEKSHLDKKRLETEENIALALEQIIFLLSDPLIPDKIDTIISKKVNEIAQSKTEKSLSTLDRVYDSLNKIIGFKLHLVSKMQKLASNNTESVNTEVINELNQLEQEITKKIEVEVEKLYQILGIDESENIKG